MNICIFGDSITWGANDYEKGGWAERLKSYCMEKYEEIDVYNLGVSGDNTNDVVRRFEKEAIEREPNLIIFAIGINDSQYVKERDNYRVGEDQFQKNLSYLLDEAKKLTSNIVFLGLTDVDESKTMPIPWGLEEYYDNVSIDSYDKIIRSFCNGYGVPYISMEGVLNDNDLEDGLHPNSQGHEKMFQKVLKELDVFLRS